MATEALLSASELPWTALGNGFYASSAITMLAEPLKTGKLAIPASPGDPYGSGDR